MRSNRRRNWLIKRIALGFAVAAFVARVAQAKVDEGIQGQPNRASENIRPIPYRWPSSADEAGLKAIADRQFVQPSPHDPALGTPSPHDPALFVDTQPQSIGEPQVGVGGFDWKDAGIGAGVALALILLGVGAALASRHVGRAQTA